MMAKEPNRCDIKKLRMWRMLSQQNEVNTHEIAK